MRKSTLFVSAMLTVFLMATMFGVASAYQQAVNNGSGILPRSSVKVISQSVDLISLPAPVFTDPTNPADVPGVVTPEEATLIAVEFLGNPDVYSVEVVDYEGAPTFLVTFSSGDMVYVSSTGTVVANTKLQPVVVLASSGGNGGGSGGQSNNNGGNSGGGDQESRDDHEDDYGDDHGDDD